MYERMSRCRSSTSAGRSMVRHGEIAVGLGRQILSMDRIPGGIQLDQPGRVPLGIVPDLSHDDDAVVVEGDLPADREAHRLGIGRGPSEDKIRAVAVGKEDDGSIGPARCRRR